MRYAFYISGKSGRLLKYIRQASAGILETIKLIISDKNLAPDIRDELESKKIEYRVIEYNHICGNSNKEKNAILSDYILEQLQETSIDYCFSFGSHILSGKLLEIYKWKLINFHPAILPMYPGVKAIDQAIEHGNTFLVGNTAHFIDKGVDTGKIIMQSVIPLQAFYEANNNYDVILDLQIEMLNKLMNLIKYGRLQVLDGEVKIKGADYTKGMLFPIIEN